MSEDLFLGEYHLLGDLSKGEGGFADVYKVRHSKLGYVRAVRVLHGLVVGEDGKDPKESSLYEKFLHECEVLLQLGNGYHPNIVRIYKPDLRENKAFVEMDYVKGVNIHEFLEKNEFFVEADEVIRLATQISSALAYCHEDVWRFRIDRNRKENKHLPVDPNDKDNVITTAEERKRLIRDLKVIHNDIHSGNIMRRENGTFVLLDFGLSINGDEVEISSSRQTGGAIAYMPPEKWDNKTITEQSDIYSLGIVLYQCLAGRVPFTHNIGLSREAAQSQIANAHRNTNPDAIENIRKEFFERKTGKQYVRDYPKWLEDAIMRCLSKDPAKRFKDGKELYEFIIRQKDNTPENIIERLNGVRNKLESQNNELHQNVLSVKAELDQTKFSLESSKGQLKALEDKLDQTQSSLKSSMEQIKKLESKKRWKGFLFVILVLLLGFCSALCVYLYNNQPESIEGKIAEYEKTIMNKNDTIFELRNQIQLGDTGVIAQKNERIKELERTITELKTKMPDVALLEEQLRKKNAQVSKLTGQLDDLNASFGKKKAEVTTLQEQLKRKDAKIRELTAIIGQKDTIIKNKNNEIRVLRED